MLDLQPLRDSAFVPLAGALNDEALNPVPGISIAVFQPCSELMYVNCGRM